MKLKIYLPLCIIFCFTLFSNIQGQVSQTGTGIANPLIQKMLNEISEGNLLSTIQDLQAFGTRYEYTTQQEAAADYIVNKFEHSGFRAESDSFSFGMVPFYDLDIISDNTFCLVGASGFVLKTSDNGLIWTIYRHPLNRDFYGVDFLDSREGWVVGGNGTIVHTTDNGVTWLSQSSGITNTLYSVCFSNENFGIVVGSYGTILKTTNGGGTWTSSNSSTLNTLRDIKILSKTNIWAIGYSGMILQSTDEGSSWVSKSGQAQNNFYSIYFINSQVGWIVGDGSAILKTTNGGADWKNIQFPFGLTTILRSICFVDSLNGFMVDYNGSIINTTDGGQNWRKIPFNLNSNWGPYFYKVRFSDGSKLIICGSRSTIITSSDKGISWLNQSNIIPPGFLHTSRNIVATIPGKITPERECIVVAHYDSYSNNPYIEAPGANDNASGTAAVLEIARICKKYQFESTIKFLAVSAEEVGLIGSNHFATDAKNQNRNIIGVVNADMIGYPVKSDPSRVGLGSYLIHNRLIDSASVYNQRYNLGINIVVSDNLTGGSDFAPFAVAGYDALHVSEASSNEIWEGLDPYYHKPTDMIDKVNPRLIHLSTQLMMTTILELAKPIRSTADFFKDTTNISLLQNYPNPFNLGTFFEFYVPGRSLVTLKIYNIMGEEIATLISNESLSGMYSIYWQPKNISSGIYYYCLQSGSFKDTKKFILVK